MLNENNFVRKHFATTKWRGSFLNKTIRVPLQTSNLLNIRAFDMFYLMQNNVAFLAKRAVDAALKGNWPEAISINNEILDKDKNNLDAKVRLGRAYLQQKEFNKAKKLFKEVLDIDPINPVAQRNYKLASEKKIEKTAEGVNPKTLIKEPGTTTEANLTIEAKRVMADDFGVGEDVIVKIDKKKVTFYKKNKNETIELGSLNTDLSYRLFLSKSQGGHVTANFINGEGKTIRIMIKSSIPVFRSEKQEIKPYIKKGSIDEPELELPEVEE